MRPSVLAGSLVLVLASAWAVPARAEDATSAVESIFGADLRRVAASADTRDDLELAGKMLAVAKKSVSQPALLAGLCEKICDLATKAMAGYPTAIEAMELLYDKVPEKQSACRQKLIVLYQHVYSNSKGQDRQIAGEELVDLFLDAAEEKAAAGNWSAAVEQARSALAMAEAVRAPAREEVQARLTELTARERVEKQVTELKARLKADPANRAARESLIRLYVVDLDKPDEAAKLVDDSVVDEALKTYVPLVAKAPADVAESVCMELAGWYRSLGDAAGQTAKLPMYERAKSYYLAYLDRHSADDVSRTKARMALESLEAQIAKLSAGAGAGWVDVLKLVDVNRHTAGGAWQRREAKVSVSAGKQARATIPVLPDGGYELEVKFIRTEGSGPVSVLLPVGSARCQLVLSANDGAASGLQLVGGKPCQDNPTAVRPGSLENGKEYVLDVKVVSHGKDFVVTSTLNGQKSVHWEGPDSALSLEMSDNFAGPRALGLAAAEDSVTFNSARLRLLSGGADVISDNTNNPNNPNPGNNIPRARIRGRVWRRF